MVRARNLYIYEYCFTSLSAQSWQYRDRRKPEAGTMPYSYFEWLQEFLIVHSTIGSTVHSMPLNSLENCICTTTMTNIRPDRDSNLVPPVDTDEPSGPAQGIYRLIVNVTVCRAVSNGAWCRIFREISCFSPLNLGTLFRCCVLGHFNH